MKVICSWCEHEGRPSQMGERAPYGDPSISHGMCEGHVGAYRGRLRAGLRKVYPVEGQMRAEPISAL